VLLTGAGWVRVRPADNFPAVPFIVLLNKYVLIAVGGAFGSLLRYVVQGWTQRFVSDNFPASANLPVGTLLVNVVGCTFIGFLAAMFAGPILVREEYRVGLTVGVLGGFTTFSAFGLETFNLASGGQFRWALANVLLSCTLGLTAVWLGYRLAQRWLGA
jgi:CrcB protein